LCDLRVVKGDTINSTVVQLVRRLSSVLYDLIKTVISQHYCAFIYVEKERILLCFFLGDRQTMIWTLSSP